MNREQQKENATVLQAKMRSVFDAFESLKSDTHQWSSEKVGAALDPEGMDEVVDATTQFDITQTLTDITKDAITQVSTKQREDFSKEAKASLMPEIPEIKKRSRRGRASAVPAFAEPATQDRKDYDEFREAAKKFIGPDAAPFPDNDVPPAPNRDRPGKGVAPPLQGDDFRGLDDAREIGAAVSQFQSEMSRFATAVFMSINDLNRRLNSLSRALESEGYDHR